MQFIWTISAPLKNNWHYLEVTVIGMLKQCIEARIAESSHYEGFWMLSVLKLLAVGLSADVVTLSYSTNVL